MLMAQTDSSQSSGDTPNKGVNTPAFLSMIAGFLLVALLAALCWFWYAGHHALSATPREGPTGVGGMTAGDKGQKKQ